MHKLEIMRKEKGLTQAQLAERAGVSPGSIARIEAESSPYKTQISVAAKIADALQVKTEALFDPLELSHLGRPAGTGRPIGRVTTIKQLHPRCSKQDCNLTVSIAEQAKGVSACHNLALVS